MRTTNRLPQEARIEISGHTLTEGQAMAVRVALQSFAMDVKQHEDELGIELARGYLARIAEVNQLLALTAR